MNEYENRAKRIKLEIQSKAKIIADQMEEKMQVDSEKKSNFSSISPSNGAIVRGSGNSNAKGDIKKLVIKNFKSKFFFPFPLVAGLRCVKTFNDTNVALRKVI